MGDKLGYEAEAFAIYDTMQYIKPGVYTLAVGGAWGEAAMLLAAGEPGHRGALPSASIMIRQPMQRITNMQASDIDIYRKQIRYTNESIIHVLSKHTGHLPDKIAADMIRPKYFTPEEASDYGLIDNVMTIDSAKNYGTTASVRYKG